MFDGLVLTRLGKAELIKATDEGCLNFTHIAFGDGVTNDLYNLKDGLSHEVARLKITEVERTDDRIILSLDYTNRSFDKGFYFRELGIIANNKLCYYDNSGSDAEYINPMNEVVTKEKRLRIELIVSESVAVETTVDSKLYALKKDLAALGDKFLTTIKNQLGDHIVKKDVPENAMFTDTWIALKGATSSEDGSAGYAPAPPKGDANRYLRSDGEWEVPPDTRYTHPGYTARSSGLYKITVDSTGHISDVTAVTKEDITALGIPGQDTNTTYGAATESVNGLMSAADKKKLDGVATGANAYTHPGYTARSSGLYKITVDSTGHISDVTAVTKEDITALGIPGQDTNTTYGAATESANGLMSAADKKKLNGVAVGANAYSHPGYTERSSGLYKITVDGTGHVSSVTAVTKEDITALGIPGQDTNTTYGAATESVNGLMSAADKKKLDGVATGANAYTHPGYTARSSGLYKITVDSTGHISDVTAVTKEDITALGIPGQDTNTTYGAATESANGLMSAADKKKLNGVAVGANAYSHPGYTERSSGLYKITVDGTGHVSSVTAVTKDDITALGIVGTSGNTDINGTLTFNSDDQGIRTSKNDYGRIGDSLHAFFETWTNNLFCKHLSNQTKIGTSSDPYDIAYLKQIIDCTTFGGSTAAEQIQFKSYSNHSIEACPAVDNRSNWGLSSKKWYSVWSYAFSGASDRKLKKDIRDIDSEWANEFIDRLKPSSYRFKDNSYGKVHTGFIAQDVEKAMLELGMDRRDFAGLVKTIKPKDTDVDYKTYSESIDDPDNFEGPDENYDYCLRYDDFIAPLVAYCQGLKKKSLELEVRCDQLEKKVELLENKIS